ncbi:hypothetical protein GGD68_006963 [Paraburkholderia fungorum]|jgi:hypothetical protein|uniref:hypothetical protein n=1 Tax=Paraburkholderia fungorum TaxID=134537 RepID=UPI00161225A9|nr:hypothetical protein [Paraburkholderia fungorum]MBB4518157.1 hypothetical protein [Paraburkholderia fungorum]
MPVWLQVLLGLAAPIIAAAGVWVGFQQWQVGHRSLKHSLFDRRWAVYAATNDALVTHINGSGDEQVRRLAEFLRRKLDAQFLFTPTLLQYLDVVQEAINGYRAAVRSHESDRRRTESDRSAEGAAVVAATEELKHLHGQLVEQFRPSLGLAHN